MINIEFYKCDEFFTGFTVKGHAGYADSGSDIVCASVSSAVMCTINTITECFEIKAQVKVQNNGIHLRLPVKDNISSKLIEGLYIHIKCISEDYPGTIKIITSEV